MQFYRLNQESLGHYFLPKITPSQVKLKFNLFVGALLLISVGVVNAATVTLEINNTPNNSGEINVAEGQDVQISYEVTDNSNPTLGKKDSIELVSVTGTILTAKSRSNLEAGNILLTVPNGTLGQLFVRYVSDADGTVIASASDPADPSAAPLFAIAVLTIDELAIRVQNLESGDIDPHNEIQTLTTDGTSLILSKIDELGGGVVPLPQGPKGDDGAVGPQGPQGIQGVPGINGIDGSDGATGAQGIQGIQGVAGNDGADGAKGIQGEVGPEGPSGVVSFGALNTRGGTNSLLNTTTGQSNTGFGHSALASNVTGHGSTAVGAGALQSYSGNGGMTAFGYHALSNDTTATGNTAIGWSSLKSNSGGSLNTAVGFGTLEANTNGSHQTAFGHNALRRSSSNWNTAFGSQALGISTTGSENTAIGASSLTSLTGGIKNVAIGYRAGANVINGGSNILISNEGVAGESSAIRIGDNSVHTTAYFAGISGVDLSADATAQQVVINSDGQLGIGPGVEGPQGIQGIAGTDGVDGTDGAVGLQGPQGIQGVPGINGIDGSDGATGAQGIQGIQGIQGEVGPEGPAGTASSIANVVTVALSGGDYTSPIDAMTNVSAGDTWCGNPSISNPCLVKIGPGEYDLGSTTLQMRSYVDIQGSGQNVTRILGSAHPSAFVGTVHGAINAVIRDLTVEDAGGTTNSTAILNYGFAAAVEISNVTAIAYGGSQNAAIKYQNNTNTRGKLFNVHAEATGGTNATGIQMSCGTVELNNAVAIASGASSNNTGFRDSNGSCGADGSIISGLRAEASGGVNAYAINAGQSWSAFSQVSGVARDGSSSSVGLYLTATTKAKFMNGRFEGYSNGNGWGIRTIGASSVNNRSVIDSSIIVGATNTVSDQNGYDLLIGASRLEGGLVDSINAICAGVYDENYFFLANTCP